MVGCSGGGQDRPQLTVNDSHGLALKIERLLADKDYAEALGAAEQLVAADPRNGDARAILGRAYLANGRYVSARTAFSDAITLRNRDPRTIISLSLCESGLGNVEGARALLASHIGDLPAGRLWPRHGDGRRPARRRPRPDRSRPCARRDRQRRARISLMRWPWPAPGARRG